MTYALNAAALEALASDRASATRRKGVKPARYAVMSHDVFQGYVQGKTAEEAFARADGLYGKRITLEPIRTGRHALAKGVAVDVNTIAASKRAPYPTPGFEARRNAEIAKAKAQGLI